MDDGIRSRVAIVDYGMGNLFSVQRACQRTGLEGVVTSSAEQIEAADGIVLPGVGAFGDAMETLRRLDLVDPLRRLAKEGRPFMGVCLGLQLLMTESEEFGRHAGLGLVGGHVARLAADRNGVSSAKVPHVGWNRIYPASGSRDSAGWRGTPLEGLPRGQFMYFVHSYYIKPEDASIALCLTQYGDTEFVSGLQRGNLFGTQFHPERSGSAGLRIYDNFRNTIGGRASPSIRPGPTSRPRET